ncbi:MAG: sulfatase [Acidobacteriota bacterium]|nr:sulfatase [Acidobacteriota bacterium]
MAAESPRNILLLVIDDLGWADVGAYNPATFYETPSIDALAASGMRFTDGYAASPVCSPTRYSILTGRYPTRAGVTNDFNGTRQGRSGAVAARYAPALARDHMPTEELTIAKALQQAGYRTFFAGNWPAAQGFDINRGADHTYRLAEETVSFVRTSRSQPFFAMLSFNDVHTPLVAPPELVEKYERKLADDTELHALPDFMPEEQVWPTEEPRRVRVLQSHAVYAAMVEAMDIAVGRVLEEIDALGLRDTTAIFFVSDNGGLSTAEGSPTSNLPLRGGKGWLYEGGIREPFIARIPGITKPGSTSAVAVLTTDLYPTFLDLAQAPPRPQQHLDGSSLLAVLRGGELSREALYWHYPHYSNQGGFPGGAVRVGRYKLLERYEDGRVHLYDLEHDLMELHDLARSQPERVAALRSKLHAWYDEVGARFLGSIEGGPTPWAP